MTDTQSLARRIAEYAAKHKSGDFIGDVHKFVAAELAEHDRKMREALTKAAMPLEAILLAVDWELSPEVMTAVREGVEAIREALKK